MGRNFRFDTDVDTEGAVKLWLMYGIYMATANITLVKDAKLYMEHFALTSCVEDTMCLVQSASDANTKMKAFCCFTAR